MVDFVQIGYMRHNEKNKCFHRSSEELTPLHIAALWGCYQNLKLLLKNGGNPNLKDQVRFGQNYFLCNNE